MKYVLFSTVKVVMCIELNSVYQFQNHPVICGKEVSKTSEMGFSEHLFQTEMPCSFLKPTVNYIYIFGIMILILKIFPDLYKRNDLFTNQKENDCLFGI